MASPTAANILASLGIKGAVADAPNGALQANFAGFVPVLDKNGFISAKFIPQSQSELAVSPLSNVLLVDPGSQASAENGSVAAPFKTIEAAAAASRCDSSGRCALLLMPGEYPSLGNSIAQFSQQESPESVFVIGLGECVLKASTFNVTGIHAGGRVFFQDVDTGPNNLQVVNAAAAYCLGRTYVGGSFLVGAGATLWLSSESWVASTDAETVLYLSEASRIKNTSHVSGDTVGDALERLGTRKIRIANLSAGSSGFAYDSSSFTDVPADASGSCDIFDLRGHDKALVDGINRLTRRGKDISADTVTANRVAAGKVEASDLEIDSLSLGGYRLNVDAQGYLVVEDADAGSSSPEMEQE